MSASSRAAVVATLSAELPAGADGEVSASSRIAVVTTSYPLGPGDPAGHFVQSDVRALIARGAEVTVIAPGPRSTLRGGNPTEVRIATGRLFGWPGALPRLRSAPWRVVHLAAFVRGARAALLRHGPFERVVAHWLMPCAWPICDAVTAPVQAVAHGSDVRLVAALPGPLRAALQRRLVARDVQIRCVSETVRAELWRALWGAPDARCSVEPCPLDLDGTPTRDEARSTLGVERGASLAVVVGRLIPDKRPAAAIAAALASGSSAVVVLGDGPERARLERAFPSARFTGTLPRAATLRWIAAADLLVTASLHEGAPTAVREARTFGVRVVAAASPTLRDWAATDPGIEVRSDL